METIIVYVKDQHGLDRMEVRISPKASVSGLRSAIRNDPAFAGDPARYFLRWYVVTRACDGSAPVEGDGLQRRDGGRREITPSDEDKPLHEVGIRDEEVVWIDGPDAFETVAAQQQQEIERYTAEVRRLLNLTRSRRRGLAYVLLAALVLALGFGFYGYVDETRELSAARKDYHERVEVMGQERLALEHVLAAVREANETAHALLADARVRADALVLESEANGQRVAAMTEEVANITEQLVSLRSSHASLQEAMSERNKLIGDSLLELRKLQAAHADCQARRADSSASSSVVDDADNATDSNTAVAADTKIAQLEKSFAEINAPLVDAEPPVDAASPAGSIFYTVVLWALWLVVHAMSLWGLYAFVDLARFVWKYKTIRRQRLSLATLCLLAVFLAIAGVGWYYTIVYVTASVAPVAVIFRTIGSYWSPKRVPIRRAPQQKKLPAGN